MAGNAHESRGTDRSPCGRDITIARRLFEGEPMAEIARSTGLSESSIRAYQTGQRRPGIREYILELERSTFASLRSRIIQARRKALDTLIALLESEDERIRLQAAGRLLKEWVSGMDGAEGDRPRLTIVEVVQLIQQVQQEGVPAVLDVTATARLLGGNGNGDGDGRE